MGGEGGWRVCPREARVKIPLPSAAKGPDSHHTHPIRESPKARQGPEPPGEREQEGVVWGRLTKAG